VAYSAADIENVQKASECHPTGNSVQPRQADGHLRFTVRLLSNGCNFVRIRPDK
jgi:hypothetical protein